MTIPIEQLELLSAGVDGPEAGLHSNPGSPLSHCDSCGQRYPGKGGDTLRLPHCPICIRRIAPHISGLPFSTRNPIFPSSKGYMNQCTVCRVYGDPDFDEGRLCSDCGLSENIWSCLICGRGGCGRYTYTHAKDHYHTTSHPFSLELATGRIWDYVNDCFVHQEEFCGGGIKNDLVSSSGEHEYRNNDMAYPASSPYDRIAKRAISPPQKSASSDICLRESNNLHTFGADEITTQKINNVVVYYEVVCVFSRWC